MQYLEDFNNYIKDMRPHTHNDLAPVTIIRNHFVAGFRHADYGAKWLAFLCADTDVPGGINLNKSAHAENIADLKQYIGNGDDPNTALYDLWQNVCRSMGRKI